MRQNGSPVPVGALQCLDIEHTTVSFCEVGANTHGALSRPTPKLNGGRCNAQLRAKFRMETLGGLQCQLHFFRLK